MIEILVDRIERDGGNVLRRYIVDLSMATDLVVSGQLDLSLCVQLTSVSDKLSIEKKQNWKVTLRYWEIRRALFVSFNPANQATIAARLSDEILVRSDQLPSSCYTECNVNV